MQISPEHKAVQLPIRRYKFRRPQLPLLLVETLIPQNKMKPIVVAADGVALAMILLAVALSIIPRGPSSAEAEITPTRLQKKPRTTERLLKEDTESIRFRVNAFTMSNNWFDSNRDWLHGGRCEV
jgi:hypothetical protein